MENDDKPWDKPLILGVHHFFWRNRGLLGCSPRHQQGRVKGWAVQSFVQLTEELENIDLSRSKVHIDHH
jgi:hypothetical protein